ncbi:Ldh family oxidoreductase [Nocardia sp. CDC159]|uniref:Ldh family oxidoreductase n=1 Tax=Nocardia pulmonis TaxID=2951408 RepID=A0A9X2E2X0_9NOCA|nr:MULTISPECIES: Ldh family oxidoreductase [Nocardia]MCM6773147.1 Ldh family oxidoreductase [Nocardia pulmonis]MCM6785550.1 Ldh family oxidoreductase [Nocardia sp. CDC159]
MLDIETADRPSVDHDELVGFVTKIFTGRGVPADRAVVAARALVYGDAAGLGSHGLANLTRLYLPLFDARRVAPAADLTVLSDRGPAAVIDAERTLGLWTASAVLDDAAERAARYGVGVCFVRNATHFGCAGFHTRAQALQGRIALLSSNCGGQRIARPPGGRYAMLGTNPLSIAAPAGAADPFVLDMSTTAVPTGKIRVAARRGEPIPEGWLVDAAGSPVTDPAALDRGDGFPVWLGGRPATGAYKGYGLALLVEVLSALVSGAGLGPDAAAFTGSGGPTGRDDDIGYFAMIIDPVALRGDSAVAPAAEAMFAALRECAPIDPDEPVGYPGLREAERVRASLAEGIALDSALWAEVLALARAEGVDAPAGALR